ncbi:MAG: hypothetical protein ACOY3Z_13570 [Thermodesulfobacteriota bacterium]
MRDYSKRVAGNGTAGRQRLGSKRSPRRGEGRRLVFKIIGAVAVAALILAVGSSLWFGMALRQGLAGLDQARAERLALVESNKGLAEEREALLQQEKVQLAAGALGLYSPTEKQIRRP